MAQCTLRSIKRSAGEIRAMTPDEELVRAVYSGAAVRIIPPDHYQPWWRYNITTIIKIHKSGTDVLLTYNEWKDWPTANSIERAWQLAAWKITEAVAHRLEN